MMRTLIVLAIVAAATAASFSDQMNSVLEEDARSCTIGKSCGEDIDCQCPDPTIICNYQQICNEESFLDTIIRKKPCFRNFKKRCTVTADCECGQRLVCEDRECVEPNGQRAVVARRY